MYREKFLTLSTVLAVAVCTILISTRLSASCDATTIAGNFGFEVHELGVNPSPSGRIVIGTFVPGAFAGQMVFDSATGHVSGFRTGNEGALPLTNTFNTPNAQSTYSVNNDCTGSLTLILNDGSSRAYEIAIVQGGAEIELAEQGGGSGAIVGDGVARRQPPTCDPTTIGGGFGVKFNRLLAPAGQISGRTIDLGAFMPADSAGLLHFDPTTTPPSVSGHLTGITDGNDIFSSPVSGAYSVLSNCTGVVSFVNSEGVTKALEMAIVEDGTDVEIEFANTTQPADQIVGEGVGKRQ